MMLALGNSEKCSRCIQTDTPFTVGSHQKVTVSVRFGTTGPPRELKRALSIDVVHEQLRTTIYEQSVSPLDDIMAEDVIVSCRSQ